MCREDCIGNPTPIGHHPASEKQVKFARWIGKTLDISLPLANSREIYQKWISSHKDEFEKELEKRGPAKYEWPDDPDYGPEEEF